MALPVFMTADVAQIQEFWIRSFAFFVALSFQEDLIQDKISQYYCSFAVFCFQWEFTAQYRPVLLRHPCTGSFQAGVPQKVSCQGNQYRCTGVR